MAPERALQAQAARPDEDQHHDVQEQLRRRAAGLVPASVGDGQADIGGGRDRGHRDEHADQRAGAGSGQRDDPDDASHHGDDDREQVGRVDEVGDGAHAGRVEVRGLAERLDAQAEEQGGHDGGREAGQERAETLAYGRSFAPVEAKRYAHDRAVLGSDDHGADDEDLGIGQDPGRGDQAGQEQQPVEARRVGRVGADPGLDHVPDRRLVALDQARVPRRRLGADIGLDRLDGDRRMPVQPEVAQAAKDRVGGRRLDVELDRVTGWLPRSGEHDDL